MRRMHAVCACLLNERTHPGVWRHWLRGHVRNRSGCGPRTASGWAWPLGPRLSAQGPFHSRSVCIDRVSPPHSILAPNNNHSRRNGTNLPSSVVLLGSTDRSASSPISDIPPCDSRCHPFSDEERATPARPVRTAPRRHSLPTVMPPCGSKSNQNV